MVRASGAYPAALMEALERQAITVGRRVDVLFKLTPALHGFDSLLLECKSGDQKAVTALEQMHVYRTVLHDEYPGPMLVLGVAERGPIATASVQEKLSTILAAPAQSDVYAFCSADELPAVLAAAGLAQKKPAQAGVA